MKKLVLCLFLLWTVSPALAQTPATPREQALSIKLMEEINQNLDYRRALIEAQAMIDDLKKQVAAKPSEESKERSPK